MLPIILKEALNKEEKKYMTTRFVQLCQQIGLPKSIAIQYYDSLSQHYAETTRYYHNEVHILNFLKLLDAYRNQVEHKHLFELAIWYHDVIYDAAKKDNEEQSALLMDKLFQPFLGKVDRAFVYQLIMSTAGHQPQMEHQDVYFFLDFDLAILAADENSYQLYSQWIEQEYKGIYPLLIYKMGRKKVLKNFLKREKLYFSTLFFKKYEAKARKNIQLELNGK